MSDAPEIPAFAVVCGSTRVILDELADPLLASDVAARHDAVHHCRAWVQWPLELGPDAIAGRP